MVPKQRLNELYASFVFSRENTIFRLEILNFIDTFIHKFRPIMNLELIDTGFFHADGGAMFGAIPKLAWRRRYPCDDDNTCVLTMRVALIRTNNGRLILIDNGAGEKQLERLAYYRFFDLIDLGQALADKGIQAVDYLLGKRPVGDKVVVVGGGLTGCEIAYDLYLQGKHPVIVEMKDDLIAVTGVCLANASYLRDFFKTNQVPVYLETTVKEIRDGKVFVAGKDGRARELPADSVILSVGYRPAPLAPKGRHVHIVGDADKVGNLRTVIWRAWDVCMKL